MRNFLAARRKQVVAALVLLVALAMFLLPAVGHAQAAASTGIHQQVAVVAPADHGGDRGGDNDGDRGRGRGRGGNGGGHHDGGRDG